MKAGGSAVTNDTRSQNEYLKVKIDLPSLQLEVSTADTGSALVELRRILEAMNLDEELAYEEFVQQELRSEFGQEFLRNKPLMDALKELLKQEDEYRLASAEIPSTTALDLDARTRTGKVAKRDVQHAIAHLTRDILCSSVKRGVVHVFGDLDRDSHLLIADHIHRAMPTAQLRAFHTRTATSRIVVECVFFGDFPEEDE